MGDKELPVFPLALLLTLPTALAAKVPVTVNVGLGPSVGTVAAPGSAMPLSVGLALSVEGWVSKKTLRSKVVKRRVPRQYKGMVRDMPDAHVRPIYTLVAPDTALLLPVLPGQPTLRSVTWAPISMNLMHQARPQHFSLSVSPRVGWVQLSGQGLSTVNTGWLGVTLSPEVESDMRRRWGVAAGAHLGPGLSGALPAELGGGRAWLFASAYARAQLRIPIKFKL